MIHTGLQKKIDSGEEAFHAEDYGSSQFTMNKPMLSVKNDRRHIGFDIEYHWNREKLEATRVEMERTWRLVVKAWELQLLTDQKKG